MQKSVTNPTLDEVERALARAQRLIMKLSANVRPYYAVTSGAIQIQLGDQDWKLLPVMVPKPSLRLVYGETAPEKDPAPPEQLDTGCVAAKL